MFLAAAPVPHPLPPQILQNDLQRVGAALQLRPRGLRHNRRPQAAAAEAAIKGFRDACRPAAATVCVRIPLARRRGANAAGAHADIPVAGWGTATPRRTTSVRRWSVACLCAAADPTTRRRRRRRERTASLRPFIFPILGFNHACTTATILHPFCSDTAFLITAYLARYTLRLAANLLPSSKEKGGIFPGFRLFDCTAFRHIDGDRACFSLFFPGRFTEVTLSDTT